MYEKARRIAGLWLSGRLSDLVFLFSILLSHPTLFAIERVNAADALREAFHLLKSLSCKCVDTGQTMEFRVRQWS